MCVIARNEAKLRALGLLTAKDDLAAAVAPPKKEPVKRKKPNVPAQPSRKSRRTQGVAPEYAPSAAVGGDDVLFSDAPEEDDEAAAAREEQRMRRYERLFRRHAEEGLQLPETATYRHTVMRVDTMSEAALSNRVRVIERAAGSYAVIKMKQFAEVSEHRLGRCVDCWFMTCRLYSSEDMCALGRCSSWKATRKLRRRLMRRSSGC